MSYQEIKRQQPLAQRDGIFDGRNLTEGENANFLGDFDLSNRTWNVGEKLLNSVRLGEFICENRYVIEGDPFNQGRSGSIYRAIDLARSSVDADGIFHPDYVAVKRLESLSNFPAYTGPTIEEHLAEAQVMQSFGGAGVVEVHDFFVTQGRSGKETLIVMEYMDPQSTLSHFIQRSEMSVQRVVGVVNSLAETIDGAAKRHIYHRDLSPKNMFLVVEAVENGDERVGVKLTDFGASNVVRAASRKGVAGTPPYISPEALEQNPKFPLASEVYVLGVLTYEMLTGELPFGGLEGDLQLQYVLNHSVVLDDDEKLLAAMAEKGFVPEKGRKVLERALTHSNV